MFYTAKRRTGEVLKPGDQVTTFRGERWTFTACTHPRKVCVYRLVNPDGPNIYPNRQSQEFFASVLDVEISDPGTGEVTFALEEKGAAS